jgi:regulator of RNase E activity RraB
VQFTYNWPDFIAFALNEHPTYEVSNGHSEDSEWNYYKKLLYPTAKEWQLIQNHKVCDNLKKQGDRLYLARAIEHKIFMPTTDKKDALIEALEAKGFKMKEEIENEEGIKGLDFYRLDKPFYHDIDTITLSLIDIAEAHDALYDGWETSVVKS